MRYNDTHDGTKTFDEVITKYKDAWAAKKGFNQPDGLFPDMYRVQQKMLIPAQGIAFTAW